MQAGLLQHSEGMQSWLECGIRSGSGREYATTQTTQPSACFTGLSACCARHIGQRTTAQRSVSTLTAPLRVTGQHCICRLIDPAYVFTATNTHGGRFNAGERVPLPWHLVRTHSAVFWHRGPPRTGSRLPSVAPMARRCAATTGGVTARGTHSGAGGGCGAAAERAASSVDTVHRPLRARQSGWNAVSRPRRRRHRRAG